LVLWVGGGGVLEPRPPPREKERIALSPQNQYAPPTEGVLLIQPIWFVNSGGVTPPTDEGSGGSERKHLSANERKRGQREPAPLKGGWPPQGGSLGKHSRGALKFGKIGRKKTHKGSESPKRPQEREKEVPRGKEGPRPQRERPLQQVKF